MNLTPEDRAIFAHLMPVETHAAYVDVADHEFRTTLYDLYSYRNCLVWAAKDAVIGVHLFPEEDNHLNPLAIY